MDQQFVSQCITPKAATASASEASLGRPALPQRFVWGDDEFEVKQVVRAWRDAGACRSGGGERSVRKQWWEVVTTDDRTMRLYFERQARSRDKRARWWLYSVGESTDIQPTSS
jgi:phosphoribosylglycinamide formyltransferase-1